MSQVTKIKPRVPDEFDHTFLTLLRMVLMELRNHSPFLGVLATELYIAGPSKDIPTMAVSPKGVVVYNEEWVKTLSMGEVVGVIMHEALHIALEYWPRFKHLHGKISNWAHDYAINPIIAQQATEIRIPKKTGGYFPMQVRLPEGALINAEFEGKSAEEIYQILMGRVSNRKEELLSMAKAAKGQKPDPRQEKIQNELTKSLIAAAKELEKRRQNHLYKLDDDFLTREEYLKREREMLMDALKSGSLGVENKGDGDPYNKQNQDGAGNQPQQAMPNDAYAKPRQEMTDGVKDCLEKYMGKEKDRIVSEVDGQPNGTTMDQHLKEFNDDLDQIADDYFKDVEEEREKASSAPNDQEPEDGNDPNSGEDKQSDSNQNNQQPGESPGESGDGQSSQKQDGGDNQPGGGQSSSSGMPQDGGNGTDLSDPSGQGGGQGMSSPDQGQQGSNAQGQGQGSQQPGGGQSSSSGMPQDGGNGTDPTQPSSDPSGQGSGEGMSSPDQGQQGSNAQGKARDNQQRDEFGAPTKAQQHKNVADALKENLEEINDMLAPPGSGAVDEEAFEKALEELAKELGKNPLDGDVDIDCSEIDGNPYKNESQDDTKSRHRMMLQRAVVEDAMKGGTGWGNMPGWAKTQIDGILHPPLSFTERMKKFIGSYGRPDMVTFKKRNKRNTFEENRPILPGRKQNSGKVYILMDTSGSMINGEDLLKLRTAMGLVDRLAKSIRLEVVVVQCDTAVTKVMTTQQAMREISQQRFEIVGQGGSDFTQGFEFIWQEMKKDTRSFGSPIVVFTDGAITVPEEQPKNLKMQVMWVTGANQKPPTHKWGQHVQFDEMMGR